MNNFKSTEQENESILVPVKIGTIFKQRQKNLQFSLLGSVVSVLEVTRCKTVKKNVSYKVLSSNLTLVTNKLKNNY